MKLRWFVLLVVTAAAAWLPMAAHAAQPSCRPRDQVVLPGFVTPAGRILPSRIVCRADLPRATRPTFCRVALAPERLVTDEGVFHQPYLLLWDAEQRRWIDARDLDIPEVFELAWKADRLAYLEIDPLKVDSAPFDPGQVVSPTFARGAIEVAGKHADRLSASVWVMALDRDDPGTRIAFVALGCSSFIEGADRNYVLIAGGDPDAPSPTPDPEATPAPTPGPTPSPPPPPPSPTPTTIYGSAAKAFLERTVSLFE